jgi:hypothetical protein
MLRIMSERSLDIEEELCECLMDWQKAFERINWTKLLQILKENGVECRERRLISKLYMDRSAKLKLDQGETRSVKIGRS